MRFSLLILILVLVSSCFHGNRLDEVKYDKLFHGGQSRIWILSSVAPSDDSDNSHRLKNELLVFSSNGNVLLSDFSKLYQGEGKKGTFSVYSTNKELDIQFGGERWFFTFEVKDEHHIILKPNEGGSTSQILHLFSVPEI